MMKATAVVMQAIATVRSWMKPIGITASAASSWLMPISRLRVAAWNEWRTLVAGCSQSGYRHELFAGLLACLPRRVTHSVRPQLRSRAVRHTDGPGRTPATDTRDVA